ncbi:WbuC family cupin fold metalloprotein [Photobacterium sp. J15]|uniref:WbuC family cupin fold metalloprotein n=1 Tax=Photobacterium sp. J15 TaxID=265901 RepID=UPI0007E477B8|nr:WbuC family cupin fold metalloprotein [Photobacterium sp. J15]
MYRVIDKELLDELVLKAQESPRKRSHFSIHSDFTDPVQRMLIGLASGTYVRPHMHPQPNKWEMLVGVRGKSLLLIFDRDGVIKERIILSEKDFAFGAEMKPKTWHMVLPLDEDSVILEIKPGPYNPSDVVEFAQWAPEENDKGIVNFIKWVEVAQVNDKYN